MGVTRTLAALAALGLAVAAPQLAAQEGAAPVQAAQAPGTPDERAASMVVLMTLDEKLTLLKGYFGTDFPPSRFEAPDEARYGSAGYVPGIPRLGIPPQWQADAGIGVATQGGAPEKRARTALPSGLAVAATWNPETANLGGTMIAGEARADGFNVLLGGSVNLMREPRNGRNFEYAGEDPLLAGTIVGAAIAGVQSMGIVSTVKHFAVNDQETDRNNGNALVDEAALRMSDLLAFQLAIEQGDPGAVMCAYNRVGGTYSCENPFLLTEVLRDEWGFPGYVLSDWGAAHSTAPAANAGLDQESGFGLQRADWFGADKLKAALAAGEIGEEQIDLMAARVLRSMFAHGVIDRPVTVRPQPPVGPSRDVSRIAALEGIVLLKNEGGLLPLDRFGGRIAVIGGHADKGVLSGGGSSQVYPDGTNAVPGIAPTGWPGPVVYYPSAPLDSLRRLLPAAIVYDDGADPAAAARLAAAGDVAIVFATQWASESIDVPLSLGPEQDALIEAVAAAQPNTIVVLETGGPVLMPWADKVPAIVEAWYPGRVGGEAIALILAGDANPSGHLPATFPRSLDQLPHPGELRRGDLAYPEGAAVGYKWYDARGLEPLFPFGHGLSYTEFEFRDLAVARDGDGLVATVEVTNAGRRKGADVVQIYVSGENWEAPRRLGGFARVELEPGESRRVEIAVDPRLLAVWSTERPGWSRVAGTYTVAMGYSSRELIGSQAIELPASHLPPQWKPAPQPDSQ